MILPKNRIRSLIFLSVIFLFCLSNSIFSLKNDFHGFNNFHVIWYDRQDTTHEKNKIIQVKSEEPDTNFTFEKYASFLKKISDTSKYIVLPLNEFRKTENQKKIVIGLRHDIDNDLNYAYKFSDTEWKLGLRSTYYVLHTAPYYLANPNDMSVHSDKIIPLLKTMQDERHFEIGLHNDLVTLQEIYKIDPVKFLHKELSWLRSNGIAIHGSASHGSSYCKTYKYLNFYFFQECTYPVVSPYVNNLTLTIGGKTVPMRKGRLKDFDLEYEAYFLNNNKYFSDASITSGVRWNLGMLELDKLKAGDRVIILLHPIHWHKASVNAKIESFTIHGQISSEIDSVNSAIVVRMPFGTSRKQLSASFELSPGALAKVSGKMQKSGVTLNDFINPLSYTVYAENRDFRKLWTINVINERNK